MAQVDEEGSTKEFKLDPKGSPMVFVFNTLADQYGKNSYFKVISGDVEDTMSFVNVRTGDAEKLGNMFFPKGKDNTKTSKICCGDIGVFTKLALSLIHIFPPQNVTLNGMKIYSDRSVSQIIGFANAVVQTAGSGLAPLFEEIMHNQNGRHYGVDTFRRYEGGGLGAEIRGDVILMGSLGFMKLMRVHMPEGCLLYTSTPLISLASFSGRSETSGLSL